MRRWLADLGQTDYAAIEGEPAPELPPATA